MRSSLLGRAPQTRPNWRNWSDLLFQQNWKINIERSPYHDVNSRVEDLRRSSSFYLFNQSAEFFQRHASFLNVKKKGRDKPGVNIYLAVSRNTTINSKLGFSMILQFLAYLKLPEIVILANEYSNQKGDKPATINHLNHSPHSHDLLFLFSASPVNEE